VTGADALKAAGLLLAAALVQVSIAEWIEVGEGHPDVVLVTLVAVALLRGPVFGAVCGFAAGLVLLFVLRRRPARL
jgi:rod shape-determining protein MreD